MSISCHKVGFRLARLIFHLDKMSPGNLSLGDPQPWANVCKRTYINVSPSSSKVIKHKGTHQHIPHRSPYSRQISTSYFVRILSWLGNKESDCPQMIKEQCGYWGRN